MADDRYSLAEARTVIDAEKCQFEGYYCVRHDALLDQGTGACDDRPEVVVVAAQLLATVERVTEMCRDTGNSSTGPTYALCADVMAAINGKDVTE